MTIVSRSFLNLMQQYKCQPFLLYRGFSKASVVNEKIQKIKEKNAEGKTKQEKGQDKNVQKDSKTVIKVCIIGGGVTPLYTAVLLKQYRIIKSINLVDTKESISETMTDARHMETSPRINHFRRKDIKQALREANIVALMDETDFAVMEGDMMPQAQFKSAANYVRQMTDQILRFCPDALVAVFARPVTATLAMVSEIFRCSGWWNPDRIVGSTAVHGAHIERMAKVLLNLEDASFSVPLAGGADAHTIVPLFSRAIPFNQFTNVQRKTLLQTFRVGDDETMKSLNEGLSLSFGTAAAKLIITLVNGLCGFDNVITCAYVRSNVLPVCRFFTSELQIGPEGIKRNLGLPKITPTEVLLIEQVIPLINEYIDMAVAAVRTEKLRVKAR